jgi:hypothetical protein
MKEPVQEADGQKKAGELLGHHPPVEVEVAWEERRHLTSATMIAPFSTGTKAKVPSET